MAMTWKWPGSFPESLATPAVPSAVLSQLRGMYVIGMAEEFDGVVEINAIWAGTDIDPSATKCLGLLSAAGQGTGHFYAVQVDAIPASERLCGP